MKYKNLFSFLLLFILAASIPAMADPGSITNLGFTHGVASGEVRSNRAIIWTRTNQSAVIRYEVATDAGFENIVASNRRLTKAKNDYTLNIPVRNLQPNQQYYYRFVAGSIASDTGTFRTAPSRDESANVRFAYTADSDGTHISGVPFHGPFSVLDAVRAENPDFFVYLGDTIYSDSLVRSLVAGIPPASTVDEYRAAYKENRTIAALPNLLKSVPTIAVWDDHEVRDNFSGQNVDPVLYANGRKAFTEYFPIEPPRIRSSSECADKPMMRVFKQGSDVDIIVLDERSCRSPSVEDVCQGDLGPTLPPQVRAAFAEIGIPAEPPEGCLQAIYDPNRTMLGLAQKERLKQVLQRSTAKYKLVINEVPMQQFFALPYDRWEGYAAERSEILNFIRDNDIANVLFLTTDMHANMMNEVRIDLFTDPQPISYEIITGPIGTFTYEEEVYQLLGAPGVGALHQVLNLAGVDCRSLNTDSYGMVEYDSGSRSLSITLKDSGGNLIYDQFNPATQCAGTF